MSPRPPARRRGAWALAATLPPLVLLGASLLAQRGRSAPPACAPLSSLGADPRAIGAFLRARCYGDWEHDAAVRAAGPAPGERAPHGKLRVYYSPEVMRWLKAGRPEGGPPDGAFIYKEMYDWQGERLTGGAFMLMRRGSSYDGWYWGGFNQKSGEAWGAWANPGCLNCHASAERQLTFADLGNMSHGPGGEAAEPDSHAPRRPSHLSPPPRRARRNQPVSLEDEPSARRRPGAAFLRRFPISWEVGRATGLRLPDENLADDWVAGPKGPDVFLPSTTCVKCHSADAPTIMSAPAGDDWRGWRVDLSPAGEWSGSLMALSGRDPVFFAQLEHEKALRPGLTAFVDNTCYRCHGVMGQRQLELDRGEPFRHEMVLAGAGDRDGKYGALARDGVSCAACHHIAPDGLGGEDSLTGRFKVGPASEIYGPYDDDVKDRPMKAALGVTPKGAAHLRSAALCGTCHAVTLPKERPGFAGATPRGKLGHEQATYLEWRNSAFGDDGAEARTCQGCHMPQDYGGKPLATKIADIEEYLPGVRGSLPRRELTLPRRRPYGRHTLVGLNYFVLSMFDQFDRLLGVPQPATPSPDDDPPVVPGPALTRRETARLAETATAQVDVMRARRTTDKLVARVRVRNLAGHKLPSGVGFRRAFLEVRLLDAAGAVLWASGRSDDLGFLLGPDGEPLPSELTLDPRQLQPHREVITAEDQVQIYEERHADADGRLTVSFLGLWELVKDNRLLPRGWRRGAQAAALQPVGVGADADYKGRGGEDEISYEVPLGERTSGAVAVEATLYYQALPPYYLRHLFSTASGRETQRLYYIASRLSLPPGSPAAGWKLRIGGARATFQ